VRGSFKELINQALDQTLSRTIITSGTVFLATMSLYLFGGGAINRLLRSKFLVASSRDLFQLYIASALVLWWPQGRAAQDRLQVVIDATSAAPPGRKPARHAGTG